MEIRTVLCGIILATTAQAGILSTSVNVFGTDCAKSGAAMAVCDTPTGYGTALATWGSISGQAIAFGNSPQAYATWSDVLTISGGTGQSSMELIGSLLRSGPNVSINGIGFSLASFNALVDVSVPFTYGVPFEFGANGYAAADNSTGEWKEAFQFTVSQLVVRGSGATLSSASGYQYPFVDPPNPRNATDLVIPEPAGLGAVGLLFIILSHSLRSRYDRRQLK